MKNFRNFIEIIVIDKLQVFKHTMIAAFSADAMMTIRCCQIEVGSVIHRHMPAHLSDNLSPIFDTTGEISHILAQKIIQKYESLFVDD